jgi:hypothetical protein
VSRQIFEAVRTTFDRVAEPCVPRRRLGSTVLAVIVAGIGWLIYLAGGMLGRFVERIRAPRS